MAQLTADQAAALGSELTGLPTAFVRALIQAEGTLIGQGGGSNNPFDVTIGWAQQTGQGNAINTSYQQITDPTTGKLIPGAWNWNGGYPVAVFNDTTAAVTAWANGINTFTNYSGVQQLLKTGQTDFASLANAFGPAYSGNLPGSKGFASWQQNVVTLANQYLLQGWSGVLGPTLPGTATQPDTPALTLPGVQVPSLPGSSSFPFGNVATQPYAAPVTPALAPVPAPAPTGAFFGIPDAYNAIGNTLTNAYLGSVRLIYTFFGLILIIIGLWLLVRAERK